MSKTQRSSFERVNYFLRPNKQVERKIMIDILQQIGNKIIKLTDCCYLGMGSIYYYDFILMHKMLGIHDMTSIDNKTTIKRFTFNKPYEFIKFEHCQTTDYLHKYDWGKKNTIVWLDYDSRLEKDTEYIISDLNILAKNCCKNDIIFITVDAQPPKKDKRKKFSDEYKKYISPKYSNRQFNNEVQHLGSRKEKCYPKCLCQNDTIT